MSKIIEQRKRIYIGCLIVFSLIYLSFILTSGYWSDDYNLWCLRGILKTNGQTILGAINRKIEEHLVRGRIFPITSIFCENLVYLLPRQIYKGYLVLLTILCELAGFRAIYKISENEDFTFLATISSVILFCIMPNYVHSVFLCFGGNSILSLIFCFTALGSWMEWLRKGKLRSEICFLIFFVLSLLTYEIAYTFIFVYILIAIIEKRNARAVVKATWKTAIVFLLVFALYAYVKIFIGTEAYDGNSVTFALRENLHGFLTSITAPLPFFSWFARSGIDKSLHGFLDDLSASFILKWILLIGLFVSMIVLYCKATGKNNKKHTNICLLQLSIVAFASILFPACLMAVTKYRNLDWGLGYIVVIYQYFGFGILFSLIFYGFVKRFSKYKGLWYAALLLYGICIITVNQKNSYYNIVSMEESGHNGVIPVDYADLASSFSKSEVLNELSNAGDLVCSEKGEQYAILNFADKDYNLYRVDSYERTDRAAERLKFFYDFIIAGETVTDDLNLVENPVIYYKQELAGTHVALRASDGTIHDITLENTSSAEKGYCLTRLTDIDGFINTLRIYPEYSIGTDLTFTNEDNQYRNCLFSGFSTADNFFTWTDNNEARITVKLLGVSEQCETITMNLNIDRTINDEQAMNLYINGELVSENPVVRPGTITIPFPRSADDTYTITFDLPNATSTEADSRTLGIGIHSIGFYE